MYSELKITRPPQHRVIRRLRIITRLFQTNVILIHFISHYSLALNVGSSQSVSQPVQTIWIIKWSGSSRGARNDAISSSESIKYVGNAIVGRLFLLFIPRILTLYQFIPPGSGRTSIHTCAPTHTHTHTHVCSGIKMNTRVQSSSEYSLKLCSASLEKV